jgi:hypothetical protein
MKFTAQILVPVLLLGCSSGTTTPRPALPPATVRPVAWATLPACLEALHAGPGGPNRADLACVRVDFTNLLSSVFILQALHVELDGVVVFSGQEPSGARGALATTTTFTVLLDRAGGGDHVLRVYAGLLPDTRVAPVFRGYRWEVRSTHEFTLAPGGGLGVGAYLFEKGEGKVPIEETPAVRYQENSVAPGEALPSMRRESGPVAGEHP